MSWSSLEMRRLLQIENFFSGFKDLAAQLCGAFVGAARNKYRSDVLKIVRDGVDYAFVDAPKQLAFLEVGLLPFVAKFPASDVLHIMKDVRRRTVSVNTDEDSSGWRPCIVFIDCLRGKYAKNEGFQARKRTAPLGAIGKERDTAVAGVRTEGTPVPSPVVIFFSATQI